MSIQATQDARGGASTQVSLAEFLSDSVYEDFGETESDEASSVAKRDDTKDDLDYSQVVIVSEHGDHYHGTQHGICACPNIDGEKIPLAEAVKRGELPCGVCHPVDYRASASQSTVGGA